MEYWEFLLQKEGDRSWLPLESSDVEILEGRYRVVARSSRANTSIEVRIMHQTTDEAPPKRRLQKRSGRTNQDGLMVVFPFTRLQPGLWEVRCSGDILSDFLGKSWQYAVRMQVLPQEHEGGEDWEPDWQQPTDTVAETSSEPIASSPDLPSESVPAPLEVNASLEPAIAAEASTEIESDPPVDHPALTTTSYSIEQLQHLAEQIVQTGSSAIAAPMSSMVDAEPVIATTPEPVSAEPFALISPPPPAPTVEPDAPVVSLAPVVDFEPIPVQLTLDQTAYMARWGRPFTLSGFVERVEPPTGGATLGASTANTPWQGEVYICLRDPQSAQVLVEKRQALATQALPYPFSCTLEIPLECRTRLLLGEMTLYPDHAEPTSSGLATQEFTITADLDELLEAIATDLDEDALLDLPTEPPSPPVSAAPPSPEPAQDLTYLNLSFLDGATTPQRQSFHFHPSAGDPLPPQIYQPAPSDAPRTLDLPTVRKPQPSTPDVSAVAVESDAEAISPDAETLETEISDESTLDLGSEHDDLSELGDAVEVAAVTVQAETETVAEAETEMESEDAIAVEVEAVPTDAAFQSLNLQNRFWSRLNALATDAEMSNWLKEDEPGGGEPESNQEAIAEDPASSPPELPEPTASALVLHPQVKRPEDEWVAQEIVVDDEPEVSATTTSTAPEAQPSALLSEDELVPTPKLEVPSGELVSGKPITVRVRIPDLPTRIYVKFWVNDRQTRSLLDGPRWLVDFTPTGLGDLEATTQLTVPFGSLEIQFEGIAVEMATQRESHKVTADRMVVPPDAPTLSTSDWD